MSGRGALAAMFDELAAELGEVQTAGAPGGTEYRRGRRIFAAITADGSSAELRLHPEVAEAARRTPGTTTSGRGPEWVGFAPASLDGHDRDRAEAWFRSAWRAAEGRE